MTTVPSSAFFIALALGTGNLELAEWELLAQPQSDPKTITWRRKARGMWFKFILGVRLDRAKTEASQAKHIYLLLNFW